MTEFSQIGLPSRDGECLMERRSKNLGLHDKRGTMRITSVVAPPALGRTLGRESWKSVTHITMFKVCISVHVLPVSPRGDSTLRVTRCFTMEEAQLLARTSAYANALMW